MRLIAILNWYSESPTWLAALTASLARAGVDHLIAIDGPYALYPHAYQQPRSSYHETDALAHTAYAAGIGLTIHQPTEPWEGNEVHKRSYAFAIAEQVAEPMHDWYLVVDGDDLVTHVPPDLKLQLETTDHHCAYTTLWWHDDHQANERQASAARKFRWQQPNETPHWNLFRAIPGLHAEGAHMIYTATLNGEKLYLRCGGDHQAPTLDLMSMRVEHRHIYRDAHRKAQAQAYYILRDQLGIENASLTRPTLEQAQHKAAAFARGER